MENNINNSIYCKHCGKQLSNTATSCPACGGIVQENSPKSKIVAFLLAWLLGGIGIHKFYLGNTAAGIIYLIFCWTLIPGIIAFVEGIIYLTMSDQDFAKKYK